LRGTSFSARADECEKITGAWLTRIASAIVSGEVCERSTSMPSQFISWTTSSPNALSPPKTGSSVHESAHGTLLECVSVMYRAPSWWNIRSAPSELLIECPPSMPMSDAIFPFWKIRSTSSAVSASSKVSEYLRIMRWTMSICSRVAETAASPVSSTGT
jgi:hypothetical protein